MEKTFFLQRVFPAGTSRRTIFGKIPAGEFFVLLALLLVPFLLGVWAFVHYSEERLATEMTRVGRERLVLYCGTLDSALNKYRYLPHILATHPDIIRLVSKGGSEATDVVNRYLEDVNAESGSMALFVLNWAGVTLATSNWNSDESFAGHDYHYRPYYQDALLGGRGSYFGVGATTGKPGFFFTEQIKDNGVPVGVAVTKVDLSVLQREWRGGGETVFITDRHGVIFLASRDEWCYRSIGPLDKAARSAMLYQRQYGNFLPPRIGFQTSRKRGADIVEIGGESWLYTSRRLEEHDWTIWFLTPLTALQKQTETLWFIGAGSVSMLVLVLLFARLLLAWAKARRAAREAGKIRAVNQRLAKEIRIRKQTERELLAAQDELLHASRMAALGQMAASMVHELSQPVTSMHMFAASCRRLAQEGRHGMVMETVEHMITLVRRIKLLIDQLKHFSRKPQGKTAPVRLYGAIDNALTVLCHKQQACACVPCVSCPDGAAAMADSLQLEQIIINLTQNALDAVTALPEEEERRVAINVGEEEGAVTVAVEDNGPGIDPALTDKVFNPFFTTKKSGEGLGLGLAIADNLARSMQGSLSVEKVLPRGARFILRLPSAAVGRSA